MSFFKEGFLHYYFYVYLKIFRTIRFISRMSNYELQETQYSIQKTEYYYPKIRELSLAYSILKI